MKVYQFTNWIMGKWKSGRVVMHVRSVGPKWVWIKVPWRKRFMKLHRSEWDCISRQPSFKELP